MVEKVITFIIEQFQAHQALLLTIAIGLIAGLLAQMILPGKGFGLFASAAIGIAGCWLGDKFISEYITFVDNHTLKRVISGTGGAMALGIVAGLFRFKKVKDKTKYRNNT